MAVFQFAASQSLAAVDRSRAVGVTSLAEMTANREPVRISRRKTCICKFSSSFFRLNIENYGLNEDKQN
jgi:hypothetical protein